MIKEITVEAARRHTRGKNEAGRLRRQGQIPAVLYGEGKQAVPLSINAKQMGQILHSASGHNTILQVAIDNAREAAMLVDWQWDPVRGSLLHTDLKRIDLNKRLKVLVPVVTQGDAKGVKTQDGLLEIVTREVEIECLPADIPDHIVVDVTQVGLNEAIRVRDLAPTDRYRVASDPEKVLLHVVALRVEAKPAEAEAAVVAAAEAAPAEPEVIKKGKQVEEGEAPEQKGKKEAPEPKGKK